MPIVHVDFWEGVGEEKVKTMIRGITKMKNGTVIPAMIAYTAESVALFSSVSRAERRAKYAP